ncbi:MAG: DUF2147 domain-containing protein [Rhizobiaceae bacterium]
MIRKFGLALAATLLITGSAFADDIVGNWRTDSGETAAISSCGGSFCIKLKTGKHAGKNIGSMAASGSGAYKGTITDPADDKKYSGRASLSGNALKMKGCILGGVICRTQNWSRM